LLAVADACLNEPDRAGCYVGELTMADEKDHVKPHNQQITPFYINMKKRVEQARRAVCLRHTHQNRRSQYFARTRLDPRQSYDMAIRVPGIIAAIVIFHILSIHL
jgi:hypothetical protein